jgi:hypothetical protein
LVLNHLNFLISISHAPFSPQLTAGGWRNSPKFIRAAPWPEAKNANQVWQQDTPTIMATAEIAAKHAGRGRTINEKIELPLLPGDHRRNGSQQQPNLIRSATKEATYQNYYL